jgi:hypothetical protein
MDADWDSVRQELIRLAMKKQCRRTDWSSAIPCDWAPQTVWDPRFGMFFTDAGAWAYIIDLLESGREFTAAKLKRPPETVGYEIVLRLALNLPELYIKIQIFQEKIWGRSFHNSTK